MLLFYKNLALLVMERGTRLDYSTGVSLQLLAGDSRELSLSVSPLRSRGRTVGAVLVFRERTQQSVSETSDAINCLHAHIGVRSRS